MTLRIAALAAAAILLASTDAGRAADPAAGEAKAKACNACHGRNGIGTASNFPNLAGQKFIYLVQQLKLFRSGERRSEQMSIVAKPLSDQDIENLAAYYEGLPPGGS